jgi:hypothetical protein
MSNSDNYQGPGHYRHYKGGLYRVLGLALNEATVDKITRSGGQRFVVYQPLNIGSMIGESGQAGYQDIHFWARDLDDFNRTVNSDGHDRPRFQAELLD